MLFVSAIRRNRYAGYHLAGVGTLVMVEVRWNIERKLRMLHDGRRPRIRECCLEQMFDEVNSPNAI